MPIHLLALWMLQQSPRKTVTETAGLLGMGRTSLSMIISGERRATPDQAKRIARLLGATQKEILAFYDRSQRVKESNRRELEARKKVAAGAGAH